MTYTATYNRPELVRGDTLLGWSVTISIDGYPATISSARSQLRTPRNSLIHEFDVIVVGNVVTIGRVLPEVTATWPLDVLEYDLEITLEDGRVVTWLRGQQKITLDRTF